jgi:hypothetical protein
MTAVYLQGIDNAEIIDSADARRAPWSNPQPAPPLS